MKKTILKTLGLLALISSSLYANGVNKVNDKWSDDYSNFKYVSASSIEELNKNVDSIIPEIDNFNAMAYLRKYGPLGKTGPISAYGPLGLSGPIINNITFDPGFYPFLSNYFRSFFGSIENGPLGKDGPYTKENYYNGTLFLNDSFAVQLRALGLWGILGPIGPLGPVGPLGVLGPNGDHGFSKDKDGNYLNAEGKMVTDISINFSDNSKRKFDLYEYYKDEEFAKSKKDLDTSFVTKGNLSDDNLYDEYIINNDDKQIVSILVLPTHIFNNFNLELSNSKGQLIAKSDSKEYINFIQFLAPKDTVYTIRVTTSDKSNEYMLYVTGSTEYLNN